LLFDSKFCSKPTKVDYKLLYRQFVSSSATPWRQIVNIQNLDLCGALKTSASLPIVANFIKHLREIIPSMLTECPKKVPYHFEALKINILDDEEDGSRWYQVPMANGIHRHSLKFHTKNDPEGFYIEWRTEVKIRKNLNVFI
jgi:hypothetical protein